MVTYRSQEFFENSGNSAYEWHEKTRDAIIEFQCGIWAKAPDWYSRSIDPSVSYTRGFMNAMCSRVQPAVPPPTIPFTGGQCTNLRYRVQGTFQNANTGSTQPCGQVLTFDSDANASNGIPGAITGLAYINDTGTRALFVTFDLGDGVTRYAQVGQPGIGLIMGVFDECENLSGSNAPGYVLFGTGQIVSVTPKDGMPDICGDPPPDYNTPEPRPEDLRDTITINLTTGDTYNLDLQFTQLYDNRSFPNGTLVNNNLFILDIDGLTSVPPPQAKEPFGSQEVPPPNSGNSEDGLGNEVDTDSPDENYFKFPEISLKPQLDEVIEYLACEDGVIETVTSLIAVGTQDNPLFSIIIPILNNLVQDICEIAEPEAIVGLPEYYDARPQAERPVIVFTYKEVIDDEVQRSTYSSTVSNPSQAAIAAIGSLVVPDRTSGEIQKRITLTNGARIIGTGNTESMAQSHFDFLLNQVDPALVPSNISEETVTITNTGIATKTLKCRFVDYYEFGRKDNVEPTARQIIEI